MYAILYVAALFLTPGVILSTWVGILDRVPMTERGINAWFVSMLVALGLFAVLFGWVLPPAFGPR